MLITWKLFPLILKQLNNLVKKKVVKTTVFDNLVQNVNAMCTSEIVRKADYNNKITEIECKIQSITCFVTTVFNAVKNEIPKVSDPVEKQIIMQRY